MKRFIVLVLLILLVACSPKPSSLTLVKVNGEAISAGEFQKYLNWERWKFGDEINAASNPPDFKKKVLDRFLEERLLLQEAQKRDVQVPSQELEKSIAAFKNHYAKPDDFEKLLTAKGWTLATFKEELSKEIRIQHLSDVVTKEALHITEKDLKKYYETHVQEFRHPEQVHARQIVTDSKEKGQALRDMIVKGSSFEEVALKYSLSPDRKNGGDLGWFERGIMPREFDQICFYLKEKELSAVIATPYGFHLFQVLEKRKAGLKSFEEVQGEIEKKLTAEEGRVVFQKWFDALHAQAEINVNEKVLQTIQ